MTDPTQTSDLPVNWTAAPPSAETPMQPQTAPPTADHRQATSKELAAKTKTVAEGRRNRFKIAGHRSCFSAVLVIGRGPSTVDEIRNHGRGRSPRTNGLRNAYCANPVLRSIPAKTPTGQQQHYAAQEPL